jgi:hypothetical protein
VSSASGPKDAAPPGAAPESPTQEDGSGKDSSGKEGDTGPRTVSVMLAHELAAAARQRGDKSHGTQFYRGLIKETVGRSSLPLKMAVIWGTVLVLLVGGAAGVLLWRREARLETERRQLAGEVTRLAQVAEREMTAEQMKQKRLAEEQKLVTELSGQVAQLQGGGTGAKIAADNRRAVFLLGGAGADGQLSGFCTGFAVRPHTLATNAHCVKVAETVRQQKGTVWAVMNGQRRRLAVTRMLAHPGYRKDALSSDVGVMLVQGTLPNLVRMATAPQLRALGQGATMYTYGFPGSLARPDLPEATITQGIVSRIMTPQCTAGKFEQAWILQHTAFVTGGTSGSPVFDSQGTVIGINSGGFTTKQKVSLAGSDGRVTPLVLTSAAAGYAYGMRIDLLREVFRLLPE